MPPHPELVPRSRVQIPQELLGPLGLTVGLLIVVGVLFKLYSAVLERYIKRLENEIEDLRKEKSRLTDVVDTFPPIIRDFGDDIRASHSEAHGEWDGRTERRRQPSRAAR
jgi:hypothetical protein